MSPLLRPIAGLMLALAAATAFAQTPPPLYLGERSADTSSDGTTALPILNNRSGQIEGFLLIEGQGRQGSALERILGREARNSVGAGVVLPMDNGRRIGASLHLESNPTLGLLCDNSAVARRVGDLAQHCLTANLAGATATLPLAMARPGVRASASLEGDRSRVTASLGLNQFDLQQPLLLPGARLSSEDGPLLLGLAGAGIEQQDIGLLGEMQVGETGWISIGGTLARARIVGTHQLPGGIRPSWNTGTIRLEGGIGDFGGEIIGRVIELPGAPSATYTDVGIGVTWRAPWRARLSVGATGLMSHGENPFATGGDDEDESNRVPYIRYEQDL